MFVHSRILVTCRRHRVRVRIEKTVCAFWICANSVHTWYRPVYTMYIVVCRMFSHSPGQVSYLYTSIHLYTRIYKYTSIYVYIHGIYHKHHSIYHEHHSISNVSLAERDAIVHEWSKSLNFQYTFNVQRCPDDVDFLGRYAMRVISI